MITLCRLRLRLLVMRTGLHIELWAAREGNIEVLDIHYHYETFAQISYHTLVHLIFDFILLFPAQIHSIHSSMSVYYLPYTACTRLGQTSITKNPSNTNHIQNDVFKPQSALGIELDLVIPHSLIAL